MNLFTYGSLMFPEVWNKAAGNQYQSVKASITGFVRKRIKGETYPAIVPAAGETVSGVLYFDLPEEDLSRLDVFEGEYYRRRELSCTLGDGRNVLAAVYIFKEEFYPLLEDRIWDPADFAREGLARFISTYKGFD